MAASRLRRALLPTWPPENVSEAMLLLVCAAALGLLIALWLLPEGAILAQPEVGDAALALLAALARPLALGLLLALAARIVLRVSAPVALGLGAVMLAGTWPAPLVQRLAGPESLASAWTAPACVALLALAAARLGAVRGVAHALLLAACGALLTVTVASYDTVHAWLLDAAGISVRGALVVGLGHARREALDSLPLLALCLAGWLLAGGRQPRCLLGGVWREGAWPALLAAGCCLAWGYVACGAALGALPGLLQPPALYLPAALLAGLAGTFVLAAGWQARRRCDEGRPSAGTLGLVAFWALALAYLAGFAALLAVALAGGLIASAGALPARLRVAGGALSTVLLFVAGALAIPGLEAAPPVLGPPALAGLAGAGAAFAGLRGSAGTRVVEGLWLTVLFVALALLAQAGGRGDLVLLCAALLVVMLLLLLLPGRTGAGRTGDAALCCLGLLAAAIAAYTA